jgi:esterase/lipase superfamily enzyme
MKRYLLGLALLPLFLTTGCGFKWWQESSQSLNGNDTTPAMKKQGMVFILPGIQGVDDHYKTIRQGLRSAGVRCAITIQAWGSQIPGVKLAANQLDTVAARNSGKDIAQIILAYQRQYPGRTVHLIGQSAGSAVAVFALEALAESGAKPVAGVILLDASLSADYDLTTALGKSTKGIVNFCNIEDVAVLEVGTAVVGNLDGGHGDSAGRTGFEARYSKLHQVKVTPDMVSVDSASHFADTTAAFTANYIAPWIMGQHWPVAVAGASAGAQ